MLTISTVISTATASVAGRISDMAIIGAILGDIAGSQFEMEAMEGRDWQNCELYTGKGH